MAQIIQLNRPHPADLVQHFVDSYIQNQASKSAADAADQSEQDRQRQLDLQEKQIEQTGAYQAGELGIQQSTQDNSQLQAKAHNVLAGVKRYMNAGDYGNAQKTLSDALAADPDLASLHLGSIIGSGPTAVDTTSANVSKWAANTSGVAAGGGTDPNAVNFVTQKATGSWLPKEGFQQQQAADLATRVAAAAAGAPNLAKSVPSPSGSPVADFEARATEALPTSAQNQTSQTQRTIAAGAQAGETQRQAMMIAAQKDMEGMKEAAKKTPDAMAHTVVQGVITDPQSYYALPMDSKKVVLQTLGRAPSKLSAAETDRINAAMIGSQVIDDADSIVKKWQARGTPITGPVLGRFNAAEGKWGELALPPGLPPQQQAEYAQDISQLREWLTALPIAEAKALAGGRTAYQVIQAVTSAAPSMAKSQDMFEGSVKGLRTRFSQIEDTLNNKQWGGKPPQAPGSYQQTATGPGGHKIGSNDGSTWYDVATGAKVQ